MEAMTLKKEDGLAIITFDQPEKVNTISRAMLDEFESCLQDIEVDDNIHGIVLISGKKNNFIAGVDIKIFQQFKSPGDAGAFSREGNKLLSRIAAFPKPVVAAIHGSTAGGGLELALACHYRIASDHPETRFSLPEVKLGLLPAAGGTQRLPALIGLPAALDMMLTGRSIYSRQAKKTGLIDETIHVGGLREAAKRAASQSLTRLHNLRKSGYSPTELAGKIPAGRAFILQQARKKIDQETHGNYPAPYRILECVQTGLEKGMEAGFEAEAAGFDKLAFTRESKMMISLFFAMQATKKNPLAKKIQPVNRIGVLGAGLMGSGITEVSVQAGIPVVLKDQDLAAVGKGLKKVWNSYGKKVSRKIIPSFERDRRMGMITPTDDFSAFKNADLVIEAVYEDLALKQNLLEEIEKVTPAHCIFATNTSSLPISRIAAKSKRPSNVIGMHYFSPVQKMPLLEIIKTKKSSEKAIATAHDIGIKQGKTVIVVSDGPGFYTTRILAPYLNEAVVLLEEGIETANLDRYMNLFGFPVGPAILMDEVGIDVSAKVTEVLSGLFEKRNIKPSASISDLLEAGFKGRKNKNGFYRYENGSLFKKKKKKVNEAVYHYLGGPERNKIDGKEVQERMVLTMINEAAHCLQEGIVSHPQDADTGAVFGLGFPPFRGGPFRYTDLMGSDVILDKLNRYADRHGSRFAPAQILKDYGKKKRMFYPD